MLVHTVNDTPTLTGSVGTSTAGATAQAHVKRPDGTVISRNVSWTDTATGAWSVTCQAGDLDQTGFYFIEVEVTFSGGAVQTFALDSRDQEVKFLVRPQYA